MRDLAQDQARVPIVRLREAYRKQSPEISSFGTSFACDIWHLFPTQAHYCNYNAWAPPFHRLTDTAYYLDGRRVLHHVIQLCHSGLNQDQDFQMFQWHL